MLQVQVTVQSSSLRDGGVGDDGGGGLVAEVRERVRLARLHRQREEPRPRRRRSPTRGRLAC